MGIVLGKWKLLKQLQVTLEIHLVCELDRSPPKRYHIVRAGPYSPSMNLKKCRGLLAEYFLPEYERRKKKLYNIDTRWNKFSKELKLLKEERFPSQSNRTW
jgi:hypothetical protein